MKPNRFLNGLSVSVPLLHVELEGRGDDDGVDADCNTHLTLDLISLTSKTKAMDMTKSLQHQHPVGRENNSAFQLYYLGYLEKTKLVIQSEDPYIRLGTTYIFSSVPLLSKWVGGAHTIIKIHANLLPDGMSAD